MKQRQKNPKAVGVGRMFAWQSRAVSQGCALMAVGFLSIYCTDTLNLDPKLVAGLLVVSKLLDGVTDIIAGYIVDKTDTKWGRGRPYELCILGMWLCTWLMFSCPPSFSIVVKCAWVICMYALVNSVFYTFLNANNTVYMVRAFCYEEQFVAINSYGSIISMLGVVAFNVFFPMAMGRIATSASGWSLLMAMIAIPLALIGMMRFIFIKETVDVDAKNEDGTKEKVNFGDVKKVLTKNPYIYIVALILFVSNFVTNMGVNVYYFTYVAENLDLFGMISAVQILAIPAVIVFPALIKKFSTAKLIFAGCPLTAFGYLLNFVAGKNPVILGTAAICYGLGSVPISMLINLLIIECANFNEWKGMQRMEGTLGCVTGFATKVGSAIGAGVLGVLLSASGYIGDINLIPDSAVMMIKCLFSVIPAVLWLVVAASLLLYKLDKLMPQIKADNEARRAAVKEKEA
ncbi:MAG: MFS transporter [Ruminococcus sp.]|nr:MFS transporter [Ruminococcus sp.]